jgi:hypothetical protein
VDRRIAEATQVGHALNMLAELPRWASDTTLPIAVRAACLESFSINLRVTFEFFVARYKKGRIHRDDYLPRWRPDPDRATRLGRQYRSASAHVAHLSTERVTETGEFLVSPTAAELKLLSWLMLDTAAEFANALVLTESPYGPLFAALVTEARLRAISILGRTAARP